MVADYNCSEGCPYDLASLAKGDIYHVAGREYDEEYAGDGEPAASTGMDPASLAADGEGNLLIVDSDSGESRVLLVAAADCASDCAYGLQSITAGYVYTIAGGGSEAPENNGPATNASINPRAVQVDARGDVLLTAGIEAGRALMVAAETCASDCAYGLAATAKNHIYTIAGGGSGLENGVPGTQATLIGPRGMALIPDGDLLVVSNRSVRLLAGAACAGGCPFGLPATSANDMYTVAGNGTAAFSGESGPPNELELSSPRVATSNSAGDVLVLDAGNGRVRMIAAADCSSDCAYGVPATVQGDIYTIAGGGGSLENGVPAMSESLFGVRAGGEPNYEISPTSMTTDATGDVLVLDGGDRVRMIAASNCAANCPYGVPTMVEGDIYTVAGNGGHGYGGDGGPATSAELGGGARGMAVDPEGDLLIADTSNDRVRLLADVSCASNCPYGLSAMTRGDIYTIVGTGEAGSKGDNKPAATAELAEPADVAVDREGDLLIADTLAVRVRFVAAHSCGSDCPYGRSSMTAGDIYPLAGEGALFYPQGVGTDGDDSSATSAKMQPPQAVAVDSTGDVLIGEYEGSGGRSAVRMVAAATCSSDCAYGLPTTVKGDIYTIAGVNSTISGFSGDGGPATSAYLDGPIGLGFDSAGNLLIADSFNNRIRVVTAATKPGPAVGAGPEPQGPGPQPKSQTGPSSGPGWPGAGAGPSGGGRAVEVAPRAGGGLRVTLPTRTLVVTPRGALSVALHFSRPTAGSIRLTRSATSHGNHIPLSLARARFSTGHAHIITLRLRLTHTGLRLLKSVHRLNCVLTVIPAHDARRHLTFSLNILATTNTHMHGR
jgi:trimeric autotransporter adhesin